MFVIGKSSFSSGMSKCQGFRVYGEIMMKLMTRKYEEVERIPANSQIALRFLSSSSSLFVPWCGISWFLAAYLTGIWTNLGKRGKVGAGRGGAW